MPVDILRFPVLYFVDGEQPNDEFGVLRGPEDLRYWPVRSRLASAEGGAAVELVDSLEVTCRGRTESRGGFWQRLQGRVTGRTRVEIEDLEQSGEAVLDDVKSRVQRMLARRSGWDIDNRDSLKQVALPADSSTMLSELLEVLDQAGVTSRSLERAS